MEELIKHHLPKFFKTIEPHIKELSKLNFSFDNPVFDFIILILLLALTKTWGLKKAFSYCLLTSALLFLASKMNHAVKIFLADSELASTDIVMFIMLVVISLVTIYYLFIKNGD